MLRSRRLALISAAVLLGLASCGDSNPRTTAAQTPAVIHLGAASTGASAEAAPADQKMMMMQDVTYVVDGQIAELAANGAAWSFPAGAQPDLARVAAIARLLGVEGEVRTLPADQGGGWMVGAADYTTATLSVSADGMLSWWYNPAPQTEPTVSSVACAQPVEAIAPDTTDDATDVTTETVMPECALPEPPADVPDEAAARQAAQQLFSDMGYATDDLEYEVYADEWGANVTATLQLGGMRSPISMSVGFGAEGAITWASGSLATPVPAGEYPLVGVEAGLTRLGDQTGYWGGYWGGPAMMTRSVGSAAAGAPTPAVAEATGETVLATGGADTVPAQVADTVPVDAVADTMPAQIADTVAIEPMCEAAVDATTDCVTEIVPAEPLVVHLTGATLGLTMVWAQDGTVWLLPAYVFAGTDGGQYTVIAVDDAFLDLPEPYPTDSLPIDSYPTPDTATADTITIDTTTIDTTTIDTTTIDTTSATSATSG